MVTELYNYLDEYIENSPLIMPDIFDPITLGKYHLNNRIIMAPMTRGRADAGAMANDLMADYYAARADAGLIITEATAISPEGYGWVNSPGIWNAEHVRGWKIVTDAVHRKNGRIFLQLWHMGRVSHPDFLKGKLPVGPSALAAEGNAHTPTGPKAYVTPRALTIDEIHNTVADYANGAKLAIAAGFDGVEIHGANGYLVDQFIRDHSNKRQDEYGGSVDNRLRFLIEITQIVVDAIGCEKVGVRLSPTLEYKGMADSNPIQTFTRAAELLNPFNLAYLHTLEALPGNIYATEGERVTPHIRAIYQGTLITSGGYTKDLANAAINAGTADAIAFGVPFIANPDLVMRLQNDAKLNLPDSATFYTPGAKGYTNYPTLD